MKPAPKVWSAFVGVSEVVVGWGGISAEEPGKFWNPGFYSSSQKSHGFSGKWNVSPKMSFQDQLGQSFTEPKIMGGRVYSNS